MYEETLSLSTSAFNDLNSYNTSMVTAATKMATLLLPMNEDQSAKKYFDKANSHNSENKKSSVVKTVENYSSDEESCDSLSTNSSNYELDLITQLSF